MFSANSSQVSEDRLYVEDVFSTWLYTGNGSTQTITNGIDLAGKGGMVWLKSRSNAIGHAVQDTSRGVNKYLSTGAVDAETTSANINFQFLSNGFSQNNNLNGFNANTYTYASWTFRKAPKFFDVVTYTGNGTNRNIAHSLGVAPGCIIVKRTDTTADWQVYHRSNANTEYMVLNTTAAKATDTTRWNSTTPTATEFTVGTDASVNASGGTYVAYLFAHDTTSDGIIQCGSFTTNSIGTGSANLGWEPQFVILKNVTAAQNWFAIDDMRNFGVVNSTSLSPNTTAVDAGNTVTKNATGFGSSSGGSLSNSCTYIYIAIRRGPMRIPTSGTSVFKPVTQNGGAFVSNGFVTDFMIQGNRPTYGCGANAAVVDRLRGGKALKIKTDAEAPVSYHKFDYNNGVKDDYSGGTSDIYWSFRRAPSFFDEVCYTGGGSTTSVYNHNLGVVPELIIIKSRSNGTNVNWWPVKMKSVLGQKALALNSTNPDPLSSSTYWASADDTATQFMTRASASAYDVNATGYTYVAYLFASCPGVSKVGSYTGNGSSQTIDCGFAAGARFVMIKRTDSTGDWYVWDSARGIVSGNDPHLSLNTTAAEVTTDDSVDTDSSGFVVNQLSATNINVSSATYIYLAVA